MRLVLIVWSIAFVVLSVVACTLTGDLKYKTSDRTPARSEINSDLPSRQGFPRWNYFAGIKLPTCSISGCLTLPTSDSLR